MNDAPLKTSIYRGKGTDDFPILKPPWRGFLNDQMGVMVGWYLDVDSLLEEEPGGWSPGGSPGVPGPESHWKPEIFWGTGITNSAITNWDIYPEIFLRNFQG